MMSQETNNESSAQQTIHVISVDDLRTILAEDDVDYQQGVIDLAEVITTGFSTFDETLLTRLTASETAISNDVAEQIKAASSSDSDTRVVVLDAKQADWIQQGVQIGMTGVVFALIMLAALLGVKLWENFSRGWRKGA